MSHPAFMVVVAVLGRGVVDRTSPCPPHSSTMNKANSLQISTMNKANSLPICKRLSYTAKSRVIHQKFWTNLPCLNLGGGGVLQETKNQNQRFCHLWGRGDKSRG